MSMAQTQTLPEGWKERDGKLRCRYEFPDFVEAMAFLTEVGFASERQEHHPDFSVHWNTVDFTVWSHDVDSVTDRDHKMVAALAKIAKRRGAKVTTKA